MFFTGVAKGIGETCHDFMTLRFAVSPSSGPSGQNVGLQFSAVFKDSVAQENECRKVKYYFKLTGENGLDEKHDISSFPFSGASSVRLMTSDDKDNNGFIPFEAALYMDRSFDIDSKLTTLTGTFKFSAAGYSCGFIHPTEYVWKCPTDERPDSNNSCMGAAQCRQAASGAGVLSGRCESVRESQCGQPVIPQGCWAPISASQAKLLCAPLTQQDCTGLACNGGQCFRINDTSLCNTIKNIGGTNCGGTGQPACPPGETKEYPFQVPNPLQGDAETVADLVGLIVKWLFSIAIPIAVAVIVYSGILFLTSKGDPGKITKAKQFLTYAVIGLAIILVGSGFISLIRSILELSG